MFDVILVRWKSYFWGLFDRNNFICPFCKLSDAFDIRGACGDPLLVPCHTRGSHSHLSLFIYPLRSQSRCGSLQSNYKSCDGANDWRWWLRGSGQVSRSEYQKKCGGEDTDGSIRPQHEVNCQMRSQCLFFIFQHQLLSPFEGKSQSDFWKYRR